MKINNSNHFMSPGVLLTTVSRQRRAQARFTKTCAALSSPSPQRRACGHRGAVPLSRPLPCKPLAYVRYPWLEIVRVERSRGMPRSTFVSPHTDNSDSFDATRQLWHRGDKALPKRTGSSALFRRVSRSWLTSPSALARRPCTLADECPRPTETLIQLA